MTEIGNHPTSGDDGGVVSVAAYSNGLLGVVTTLDGLNSRPEVQAMSLPAGSDVYAGLFNGRVDAHFTPLPGYHIAVSRNAGDNTAAVIASDSRDLPAGLQKVGYTGSPPPGDYWEGAVAVVTAAS